VPAAGTSPHCPERKRTFNNASDKLERITQNNSKKVFAGQRATMYGARK